MKNFKLDFEIEECQFNLTRLYQVKLIYLFIYLFIFTPSVDLNLVVEKHF